MDDNYFQLNNADDLMCRVVGYGSIPILAIHVHRGDNQTLWHLTFVQPAYFRFPMTWKGCRFRLGTREEREALVLLRDGGVINKAYFTQFRLFVAAVDVDLPTPKTVQILALRGSIERAKPQ